MPLPGCQFKMFFEFYFILVALAPYGPFWVHALKSVFHLLFFCIYFLMMFLAICSLNVWIWKRNCIHFLGNLYNFEENNLKLKSWKWYFEILWVKRKKRKNKIKLSLLPIVSLATIEVLVIIIYSSWQFICRRTMHYLRLIFTTDDTWKKHYPR